MDKENIAISLGVDELDIVNILDASAELKLNWEDIEPGGAFEGDNTLSDILREQEVDGEDIYDIHLPPGTSSNPGMSATRDNIINLVDFSYSKCRENEDIFFTTHAPKKYNFLEQMWVFDKLFRSMDTREISIENNSAVSKWYEKEQISFWGFCGDSLENMEDLYLTIDSAHLPQYDGENRSKEYPGLRNKYDNIHRSVDPEVISEIARDLEDGEFTSDKAIEDFLSYISKNVEKFNETAERDYFREDHHSDPYLPLAQTVAMCGNRIKSIHLNDPETNNLPTINDYKRSDALQDTLAFVEQEDIYLVAEPEGETTYQDALRYEQTLSKMLD